MAPLFSRIRTSLINIWTAISRAQTIDDAFKWMNKIDKLENKHFRLRPEYRVIGELMNHLKVAEGKDNFILQTKLNGALRLVEWREAYDPKNPENYGVLQSAKRNQGATLEEDDLDENHVGTVTNIDSDNEEEYDDMKEKEDALLEKINAIDKQLEEKLAVLDHTFGRKGQLLEEDIKDLAEERNSLTEKKRTPLYRKGFDVKIISVSRSVKVTTVFNHLVRFSLERRMHSQFLYAILLYDLVGRMAKYSAILACGNYHGVVGFAKAKGPKIPVAVQKIYLWPVLTRTGIVAGRKIVETILNFAGFKNVKRKVVGLRKPFNTVKALFKALTAIETSKDVQEKFGRTVVEKHLL